MRTLEANTKKFLEIYRNSYNGDGLAKAVRTTGVKYLGEGNESVVVADPQHPDEAIAVRFARFSPEDAKLQYHLQRVMNTLFPHNFPRFFQTSAGRGLLSNVEGKLGGSVRERIHKAPPDMQVKYPFGDVKVKCEAMGIPISLIDPSRVNYMIGTDGGEYYVDNLGSLKGSLSNLDPDSSLWRLPRILRHMEEAGHTDQDKLTVVSSMARAYVLADSFGNIQENAA